MEYKKYNKVIIDVYNVIYRSMKLSSDRDIHNELVENFFKLFEDYKRMFCDEHTQIYCLFDNANTLFERKCAKSSSYKKDRKKYTPPNWFFRSIDLIESIISSYQDGVIYYRVPQWEADDYVPSLISTFSNGTSVLLISTDLDWCRCLSDSNIVVEQYTGFKVNQELADNGIITINSFQRKFKFKPTYKSVCFYKSFYGDDSDCIKPIIEELPMQYFRKIISECKNMEDFIEKIENKTLVFDLGWTLRIKKDKELLLENWKLVTAPFLNKEILDEYKHISVYNGTQLKLIYANLNLTFDKRFSYSVKTSIYDMLDGTTLERDIPKSILDKNKVKFDKPNSKMGTKKDNGLRKNIFNDL